jgi:hypothetical protein
VSLYQLWFSRTPAPVVQRGGTERQFVG